jgi:hypothetical protein
LVQFAALPDGARLDAIGADNHTHRHGLESLGVMSIWRRSLPRVQKKVPAVEENSPSCHPASIHSS